MKTVLLAIFALSSSAHAMIVGGEDVTAHDPIQQSTAAMYEPSSNGVGGALCTASIIGKNTALTAAHCLQKGSYAPVMIFGSNIRSPDSVQRPVTGVAVNPAWAEKHGHGMDQGDIAVVKFGGGLPPGYAPATLDSADNSIKKGDAAILAGYGVSDAKTHQGAGALRKTSVAVNTVRKGKSEMILDQSHGRGACHGDSGGPAYFQRGQKMILAGVTNRSYPNTAADDCAHKVVYTKVAAYRPWIEKSEADLNRNTAGATTLAQNASAEAGNRLAKHEAAVKGSRGAKPAAAPKGAKHEAAKNHGTTPKVARVAKHDPAAKDARVVKRGAAPKVARVSKDEVAPKVSRVAKQVTPAKPRKVVKREGSQGSRSVAKHALAANARKPAKPASRKVAKHEQAAKQASRKVAKHEFAAKIRKPAKRASPKVAKAAKAPVAPRHLVAKHLKPKPVSKRSRLVATKTSQVARRTHRSANRSHS